MNKNELLIRLTDRQQKYEWIINDEVLKYKDKVSYICHEKDELGREHGIQNITVAKVLRGDGCPKCNGRGMDKELFVHKSTIVHKGLYTYDKFDFIDKQTESEIYCTKHHIYFKQKPSKHLIGQGCPKCRYEKSAKSKTKTTEKFIKEAKLIFGDKYDYSDTVYYKDDKEVEAICHKKDINGIEHGKFSIIASNHLQGHGCPICGREKTIESRKKDFNEFVNTARKIHGNKYEYIEDDYINASNDVTIVCPIHGKFKQKGTNHTCLHQGCPKCSNQQSLAEEEIVDYIHNILEINDIVTRNRNIIPPLELDIYIPSKSIAIEFDGLYWHNELNKDKDYHLNKTIECDKKGIRLIHIFEDEWLNKKDIVISILNDILDNTKNHIDARECEVIKIDNASTVNDFLIENHLQGTCPSTIRYGLYHNGGIVSIMTFGKSRHFIGNGNYEYELLRFCNKKNYNVIGAASKIFKHFIKEYNPSNVVSYADRRWSIGKLYEKLGFILYNKSKPNYYYVIGNERKNRFNFRKSELICKYNCPKDMSEYEFCLSQKWYRIYDCGCLYYKWAR